MHHRGSRVIQQRDQGDHDGPQRIQDGGGVTRRRQNIANVGAELRFQHRAVITLNVNAVNGPGDHARQGALNA